MGIVLAILGLLALCGSAFLMVRKMHALYKEHASPLEKKQLQTLGLYLALAGLGGVLLNLGFAIGGNWNVDPFHWVIIVLGGLLVGVALGVFGLSFYLHYYRNDLEKKHADVIKAIFYGSMPLLLLTLLLSFEGLAPYWTYPLISGFAINGSGFQWLRPGVEVTGGLQIKWYGVVIVLGALLTWKVSDHRMYQVYGKHGLLDGCFLISFPAGVIFARVWYVIGNWNGDGAGGVIFSQEIQNGNWWRLFAVWEGGLTILGGVVGGFIVGFIFMMTVRRDVDVRIAMDMAIPCIFLAQAVGRFGNLFNHEVYGQITSMANWPLLPTWIKNNMALGWFNGQPLSDQMYVPLFLIEGLVNMLGFFIIILVIPKIWKKKRALGSLSGFYFIWYGIVRMIMEPLRDRDFNMGANGMWSFWNAMIYIIIGVALIGAFQYLGYWRKKRGLTENYGRPRLADGVLPAEETAPEEPEPEVPVLTVKKGQEKKNDLSKPKKIVRRDDEENS